MLGRILVFASLLYHWAKGANVCSVTCEEGQFCFHSECRSCPYGSFLDEPIHQRTSCTPWTTKPTESHFVIARNGSAAFDVLWICEDGYVQSSDSMCLLPTTTSHSSLTTQSTTLTSVSTVPTTTAVTYNNSEGNYEYLAFLLIPILLIICSLIICRKYKICSQQTQNLCGLLHCSETELPDVKVLPDKAGGDQEGLLSHKLPEDINFQFFYPIIQKLVKSDDDDAAEKFLRALPDPSKDFQAENSIQFQREVHRGKENYLTYSCLDWAQLNWDTDHITYVCEALKLIKRMDIVQQIQEVQHDKLVSVNSDVKMSAISLGNAREDLSERSHSDRFTFWFFLANKLDVNDSEKLLYRLPHNDNLFNAKNFYDKKRSTHSGFQLAFVDTLDEWHLRHPDCAIVDCITKILQGIGRFDVINDEEFLSTSDVRDGKGCLSANDFIDGEESLSPNNVIHGEGSLSPNNVIHGEGSLSPNNVIHGEGSLSPNDVIHGEGSLSPNDVIDAEESLSPNNVIDGEDSLRTNDVRDGEESLSTNDVRDGEESLSTNEVIDGDKSLSPDNVISDVPVLILRRNDVRNGKKSFSRKTQDKSPMAKSIAT